MTPDAIERTATMWGLDDYAALAPRLAPASASLVETVGRRLGPSPAGDAVDLAAGTGSLAYRLADLGWRTTAADIAPVMIEKGKSHQSEGSPEVDWVCAPLDDVPLPGRSHDLVGSSFGLIFAPDPDAAVAEVARLLRPGGLLVFSAWTPTSYMAEMTAVMSTQLPQTGVDAFTWGDAEAVEDRLSGSFSATELMLYTLPWEFASPEEATRFLFSSSPTHVAAAHAVGEDAAAMRRAVHEHLESLRGNLPDGRVRLAVEYAVVSARRL